MLSKKRGCGVLLNISSLPGEYSIGTFGKEVEVFCDFLKSIGCRYWQILPITAVGMYNSPYSSVSAFAGNYLYISPDIMYRDGFIDFETLQESKYNNQVFKVDYNEARKSKKIVLEKAFELKDYTYEIEDFLFSEGKWVKDYASFMSIKEMYDNKPWWEWPEDLKKNKKEAVEDFISKNIDRFNFYVFEQMVFSFQWKEQLEIIHNKGIKVIGDMPIYVSHDSVDIWANPKNFQVDENLSLTNVAGVPPDYFSQDGQLWGNPLYDFDYQKKENYKWWINRFERMFKLYDILRLDHFRAFDRYYSIDASANNAKNGIWKNGPGIELFNIINEKFSKNRIIAEDLGTIDDSVRNLLEKVGYPGMRVVQFAFEDFDSIHLPHHFIKNSVVYTATHDNTTTLGWLYCLDENIRNYVIKYLEINPDTWSKGGYESDSVKTIIKRLIQSVANLVIIPYQDLCGYGADTRMNIPGVATGNWEFRLTYESYNLVDKKSYLDFNNTYGRNNDIM